MTINFKNGVYTNGKPAVEFSFGTKTIKKWFFWEETVGAVRMHSIRDWSISFPWDGHRYTLHMKLGFEMDGMSNPLIGQVLLNEDNIMTVSSLGAWQFHDAVFACRGKIPDADSPGEFVHIGFREANEIYDFLNDSMHMDEFTSEVVEHAINLFGKDSWDNHGDGEKGREFISISVEPLDE